jgi:hypothetical protein
VCFGLAPVPERRPFQNSEGSQTRVDLARKRVVAVHDRRTLALPERNQTRANPAQAQIALTAGAVEMRSLADS